MINEIIEKTVETLKKDLSMRNVCEWRKINGLVPSRERAVSVGCDDLHCTEYSQSLDECAAVLKIYASLDNRELIFDGRKADEDRLEYGERAIREFAENIRMILTDDYTLNGLIDASTIEKIEFVTADAHEDLHIAVLSFDVKYYADRSKNYRNITAPIALDVCLPGRIFGLPVTPVVDINVIDGFEKGKDYEAVPEGIHWLGKSEPEGVHMVSWKFDAASAKAAKIGMIVNDESTKFGGSE